MAPTEGSDIERGAISAAVRLAQRFDADLRLVRVQTAPLVIEMVPRPPVLEITEQTLLDERLARLHKLEAFGTELRALGHIRVITALEDGLVAPTLRDYAKEFNVDLIVMSSHSRGWTEKTDAGQRYGLSHQEHAHSGSGGEAVCLFHRSNFRGDRRSDCCSARWLRIGRADSA